MRLPKSSARVLKPKIWSSILITHSAYQQPCFKGSGRYLSTLLKATVLLHDIRKYNHLKPFRNACDADTPEDSFDPKENDLIVNKTATDKDHFICLYWRSKSKLASTCVNLWAPGCIVNNLHGQDSYGEACGPYSA